MPSPTDALSAGLRLSLAGISRKPGNESNGESNNLDTALAAGNKLAEITKHHVEYESSDSQPSSTQNILKSKYIVLDTKSSPGAQNFNGSFSNGTKDASCSNGGVLNGNKVGNNGSITSHQNVSQLNGSKGVHQNGLTFANVNGIAKTTSSIASLNGVKKGFSNGIMKGAENGSPKPAINSDSILPEPKHVLYPPEKVTLGWQRHFRAGAGMVNVGNTCYLNATLQALFHVPAFVEWLLNDTDHAKKCELLNGPGFGDCITCSMAKTLRLSQSHPIVKPHLITNKIKMICRHMSHGSQEDAHEFMRHLLENMEKAYLVRCKAQKLDPYSKETTPINQIFGGYIRTEVKCLRCNYASTTFQHFQDLILDIRKASKVEEAMDQYFSREKLDGENSYKCEKCKCGVPATKKFSIERPPKVLCIQLKRFNAVGMKFSKPVEHNTCMDLRKYVHPQSAFARLDLDYKLISMVTHVGPSSGCGHYTAIAQCASLTYHLFDDTHVTPVGDKTVSNSSAYILMYEMKPQSPKQASKFAATSSITSISALSHKNHGSMNGASKIPLHTSGGLPSAKDRDRVTFGLTPKPTSTQPRLVIHPKKPENNTAVLTPKAPINQNGSLNKEGRPANFIGPIQVVGNGKHPTVSLANDKPVASRIPKAPDCVYSNPTDVSKKELTSSSKSNELEKKPVGSLVPYECDEDSSSRDSSLSPPLNDDQEVLTVKATKPSDWQVTNSSGLRSPSIHSESSNHSVASATGSNWNVTENQSFPTAGSVKGTVSQKLKEKKLKDENLSSVNYSSDPEVESQAMKANGVNQLRAKSAERDASTSGNAFPTKQSQSLQKGRVRQSSVSSESDCSSSSKLAKKRAKMASIINDGAARQNEEGTMTRNDVSQDATTSSRSTEVNVHTSQQYNNGSSSSTWSGNGNTNTVNDLMKMSHQGFGNDRVTSWNGDPSHIERAFDEERQASWKRSRDEYEEELDRGRMKKVKKDNRYRPYPNSFQHRPGSTPFHHNRKYNNYNSHHQFKNRNNHGHRKWQSDYYKSTDYRYYHRN